MTRTLPMRHALTPAQLSDYDAQGYLILRRLFDAAEVAELATEADGLRCCADLVVPGNLRVRWMDHVDTGAKLFEVFDPIVDVAPVSARRAADRRTLDALASIYGEEACLFKDKLIFKPPGARGYGLHQDYIAWPGFPKTFVTVVVAIDPFDAASGGTEVFPGRYKGGYLGPPDGSYHEIPADRFSPGEAVILDLNPGDMAVFGCLTPHRSAPNRSGSMRRGLFLSYNACSDGGDQRAAHYAAFHDYLRRYAPQRGQDPATLFFR